MKLLFDAPIVVIILAAAIMVAHAKYPDGFFGKAALCGVIVGCLVILFAENDEAARVGSIIALWSMAIFLVRHIARFMRWWWTGVGTWPTKEGDKHAAEH